MHPNLAAIFAAQDNLIARRQALLYLTEEELRTLVGRRWPVVMPGIYASSPESASPRQKIRAALLHAGEQAQLTDVTGLTKYALPYVPGDHRVHLLVPDDVQRVSRDFVSIRRTIRLPEPRSIDGFPVAPPDRALADFIVRHTNERDGLAVAAAAVQRRFLTVEDLEREAYEGPARGRPRLLRIVHQLHAGVRSAPEADFRQLVLRSRLLPEPIWNGLLELPGGILVSPDGLWKEARLVHEVNGKDSHSYELAGENAFEDMQRRAAYMTASGLTVVGSAPGRVFREGDALMRELAACYQRQNGLGLPPGVRIVRYGPPGTPRVDAM